VRRQFLPFLSSLFPYITSIINQPKLTNGTDLGTLPRLVRHRLAPGLRNLLPDGRRQEPQLDPPCPRYPNAVRAHWCAGGESEGRQVASALDGCLT
jgi:hypothetical protein